MDNKEISDVEWSQFNSIPKKQKIDCMEAYLIGKDGKVYRNMQSVGALVFGNENSFTVSLVHRCYNFSQQNGGRYKNGCKFEQTYGYRVTRRDIEAFVNKYPHGTFNQGITFEDFLMTRLKSNRSAPVREAPRQIQYEDDWTSPEEFPQQNTQTDGKSNISDSGYMVLALIGIIVLILLFVAVRAVFLFVKNFLIMHGTKLLVGAILLIVACILIGRRR